MKCKNAINPPDHTKPIGKYSPAILAELSAGDQLLFVSGQVSSDAAGNVLGAGDARQQAEIVFSKIEQILSEAGGSMEDIVNLTIYLTDISLFSEVSSVRNHVLPDPAPASTLVAVSSLAVKEHLVEISAIAVLSRSRISECR
jgi:enamine deaminase RidA (YjgF/YER057c/UK114 family)